MENSHQPITEQIDKTTDRKLYNGSLALSRYYLKIAKTEEEKKKIMDDINSLKLVYNLNVIMNSYVINAKIEKINDEKQKQIIKNIIDKLGLLIS